jgi:LPS export ABC transporter permease LptG/LPS export ABC transporter permease LptF
MVGTGMKTLDRYVIREILPPFVIAMLVFTFILIIPFIIELAEQMIAKGVPWPMLLRLMVTLLPSALALTIPMALLIGILVAFGRLSADREVVVMMACGISPYRLLRPLALLAFVAWAASSWVLLKAMPDANQSFRELTMQIVADRAEGEVRPRVFFEDFPNMVLYVREVPPGGGWQDVLAADTKNPSQPIIYLARKGRMLVDRQARTIQMVLQNGARHTTRLDDPSAYEVLKFEQMVVSLDPESVFPRTGPARGDRELSVAELRQRVRDLEAAGVSTHNPIMEIHKKFSIPVACFVFALLGLALGASNRKDGKLASFVLGIGVIFVYYVVMFSAQAMTKGYIIPAWLSMWLPNIVLGLAGVALLVSRARSADQPIRISLPRVALPRWITERLESRRAAGAPGARVSAAAPGARPAGDRVVVVVRIPQFELPRPNLLDIYVGRQYLRILGMTIVAMLGLFYISTFIDLSDKWFKGQTTFAQILAFLWWSTPQFMAYIIALAVLLAALVTIGVLTKNSELIVMRACGVSLYRTAAPMLAFALAASAVLFGMEERVLALANRRADQLKHLIRGGSAQTFDVLNRKWIVGRNGEVYHYQFFNPRTRELNGLSVFEFDGRTHDVTRRVYAQRAVFQPAADGPSWQLSGGWTREFGPRLATPTFKPFDEIRTPLETAEYFMTEVPEPRRMTYPQLSRYIDELRQSGYDVLEHEVELHRKVAFPFVTLVMTFIAVPFAVTTGRRGAMYGIGVGIVLALVYWTMISVFAAFGAGGVISPLLAAWAPNLLFGAAAIYLLLTVRT